MKHPEMAWNTNFPNSSKTLRLRAEWLTKKHTSLFEILAGYINEKINSSQKKCRKVQKETPLKFNIALWKMMFGRWKFPFGMAPMFMGYAATLLRGRVLHQVEGRTQKNNEWFLLESHPKCQHFFSFEQVPPTEHLLLSETPAWKQFPSPCCATTFKITPNKMAKLTSNMMIIYTYTYLSTQYPPHPCKLNPIWWWTCAC